MDKVAVAPLLLCSQLVFPKKLDSVLLLEPFLSRRRGRSGKRGRRERGGGWEGREGKREGEEEEEKAVNLSGH